MDSKNRLKTLKDIAIERGERVGIKNYRDCLVDPDIVKQEAIKWAMNKLFITMDDWTEFFNITESDLKEKEDEEKN